MTIIIDGTTGISSIGALSGVTSISGTNATLTGVTSVASNSADTPVILQDSSSNSNTCRAWVNFNGTGTVAIRADFNVTSITDNGTGDYTVNFTNAMPNTDYGVSLGGSRTGGGVSTDGNRILFTGTYATSSIQIFGTVAQATPAASDFTFVNVAIFR